MLEICSFSFESCLTAQRAGAGRVELCGGMFEGGTTPSAGLISLARQNLTIKLYVMIRPRGGEFCYSDTEFEVMKADILTAKNLGADGVVFGILNPDGSIDKKRTVELVNLATPLKVTFHRAFDVASDPIQALEDIIDCGCERILTSGQKNTAIEGIDLLKTLVEKSQNRIEIMAGSGVSAQNAQQFLTIGVHALHMTGKGVQESKMIFRKPDVSMASAAVDAATVDAAAVDAAAVDAAAVDAAAVDAASLSNEYEIYEADFEKCKAVVEILKKGILEKNS